MTSEFTRIFGIAVPVVSVIALLILMTPSVQARLHARGRRQAGEPLPEHPAAHRYRRRTGGSIYLMLIGGGLLVETASSGLFGSHHLPQTLVIGVILGVVLLATGVVASFRAKRRLARLRS